MLKSFLSKSLVLSTEEKSLRLAGTKDIEKVCLTSLYKFHNKELDNKQVQRLFRFLIIGEVLRLIIQEPILQREIRSLRIHDRTNKDLIKLLDDVLVEKNLLNDKQISTADFLQLFDLPYSAFYINGAGVLNVHITFKGNSISIYRNGYTCILNLNEFLGVKDLDRIASYFIDIFEMIFNLFLSDDEQKFLSINNVNIFLDKKLINLNQLKETTKKYLRRLSNEKN